MKRLMSWMTVGALVLASTACGKKASIDDMRSGMPDSSSAKINAPQNGSALVGDTSEWYEITLGATTGVNVTVVGILVILDAVVQQPPTSQSGSSAVWGPWSDTNNPLDPFAYKLTVTDNGDHTYSYNLDVRNKNDPDQASSYQTILSGKHAPAQVNGANDKKHGNGNFLVDWDARNKLNPPAFDDKGRKMQGTWEVTYDNRSDDAKVDVNFNNILNDQSATSNATYHYDQPKGGDGKFQFSADSDVNKNGTEEFVTIESRWKQDGSGRSDITVTKGDVPAGQTGQGSQCWGTDFKTSFEALTVPVTGSSAPYTTAGGAESACSFAAAEYYGG